MQQALKEDSDLIEKERIARVKRTVVRKRYLSMFLSLAGVLGFVAVWQLLLTLHVVSESIRDQF